MLLLAARLKWIVWDVSQSFSLRLAITVFTIVLLYSVGQVNVVNIPHQKKLWIKFSFMHVVFFNNFLVYMSVGSSVQHKFHDKASDNNDDAPVDQRWIQGW